MFEHGRKPSQEILVVFLHRKWQKLQRISVPTDRQTLLMHRYLQSQGSRRSVGTPLKDRPPGLALFVPLLAKCTIALPPSNNP